MPLSFMNDSVEVVRAPTVDRRGSKVRDWDNAESHIVSGCLVTALSTHQDREGRVVQVADRKTLRAPLGADVQSGDRVVHGGVVYEVDGEPHSTPSPTGRASNLRCALARWKG